jgi:penicillin-binding protein 1A
MVQAPAPLAPIPPGNANRPAPTRTSTRPEAAAGLDGWLVDRLFGR